MKENFFKFQKIGGDPILNMMVMEWPSKEVKLEKYEYPWQKSQSKQTTEKQISNRGNKNTQAPKLRA